MAIPTFRYRYHFTASTRFPSRTTPDIAKPKTLPLSEKAARERNFCSAVLEGLHFRGRNIEVAAVPFRYTALMRRAAATRLTQPLHFATLHSVNPLRPTLPLSHLCFPLTNQPQESGIFC